MASLFDRSPDAQHSRAQRNYDSMNPPDFNDPPDEINKELPSSFYVGMLRVKFPSLKIKEIVSEKTAYDGRISMGVELEDGTSISSGRAIENPEKAFDYLVSILKELVARTTPYTDRKMQELFKDK